jgi:hypothetical protein
MRTTVTLDPDVERLLKAAAREKGAPFKQVLNDAVREGLRVQGKGRSAVQSFRQRTFKLGAPRVDLTKANQLADEIGDADVIARWQARQ